MTLALTAVVALAAWAAWTRWRLHDARSVAVELDEENLRLRSIVRHVDAGMVCLLDETEAVELASIRWVAAFVRACRDLHGTSTANEIDALRDDQRKLAADVASWTVAVTDRAEQEAWEARHAGHETAAATTTTTTAGGGGVERRELA